MSPEQAQTLVERIGKDWTQRPDVAELCRAIFNFVVSPPRKAILTHTMIRSGAGISPPSQAYASAIEYLLGDIEVLELTFEILGEDGFPVPISVQEAADAHERMINPLTGDLDEGIAKQILTFLRPAGALNLD